MSKAIQSILRTALFLLFMVLIPALPLTVLMGTWGAMAGLGLVVVWGVWVYFKGPHFLFNLLQADQHHSVQLPMAHALIREHARRMQIPTPSLGILDARTPNLAVFGFNSRSVFIVVTAGLLEKCSRAQLSALLARALVQAKQPSTACHTWFACFLWSVDRCTRILAPRSELKRHSMRHSIVRLLSIPASIVPAWILTSRETPFELDRETVEITKLPQALFEAYRVLEAESARDPLIVPFSTTHLFIRSPAVREPLAQMLLDTHSLSVQAERLKTEFGLYGSILT